MPLEPISAGHPLADQPDGGAKDNLHRFPACRWLPLRAIAGVIATAVALLFIDFVWLPGIGWSAILHSPWLWLGTLLSIATFGAVLVLYCGIRRLRRYYSLLEPTFPEERKPKKSSWRKLSD
jgi:hypothetical protein